MRWRSRWWLAAVLGTGLAGCGGSSPSVGERYRALVDQLCACTHADCVADVRDELRALDPAGATADDLATIDRQAERARRCSRELAAPTSVE